MVVVLRRIRGRMDFVGGLCICGRGGLCVCAGGGRSVCMSVCVGGVVGKGSIGRLGRRRR